MEGGKDLKPPTQATKTNKTSKYKSKPPQVFHKKHLLQKPPNLKLRGVCMWVRKVREMGKSNNQEEQGWLECKWPANPCCTLPKECINMGTNTSLSMPSQKGMDIENSSYPIAQNTGEVTQFKRITPYIRKKKEGKETRALREHTGYSKNYKFYEWAPIFFSWCISGKCWDATPLFIYHSFSTTHIIPNVFRYFHDWQHGNIKFPIS